VKSKYSRGIFLRPTLTTRVRAPRTQHMICYQYSNGPTPSNAEAIVISDEPALIINY
jgi:hypothetical protein